MTAPVRSAPPAARILVVEDEDNIPTALEFLILREGDVLDRARFGNRMAAMTWPGDGRVHLEAPDLRDKARRLLVGDR